MILFDFSGAFRHSGGMERLIDHNPTDDELHQLCGDSGEALRQRLQTRETAPDDEFDSIVALYMNRGDMVTAKKFQKKISDPVRRFNSMLVDLLD